MHSVLHNLVHTYNIKNTYVYKDDPFMGILSDVEFSVWSTSDRLKVYTSIKIRFGRDMIIPIKHKMDWELICQKSVTNEQI